MNTSGEEFENSIARILKKNKIDFQRQVSIHGLQTDFLIYNPDGSTTILEAKSWTPNSSNLNRARNQVDLYKKATGADHVYLIFEGLEHGQPSKGIIPIQDLDKMIVEIKEKIKKTYDSNDSTTDASISKKPSTDKSTKQKIFAAMPFDKKYDDVFFIGMTRATEKVNATCIRNDREVYTGDIVTKVKKDIKESVAIIADLSESNPNVLYEMGYAEGIKKPIVPICSTSLGELPFDVRNLNILEYSKGQVYLLEDPLSSRLEDVLK